VALSVAGLLALINAFSPHPNIAGTICLLFAFSLVLSMVVLFRHVLGATDISAQSMYAALGCYLLLGLTFALADQSAALFYGSFFAQGGHHPGGDFAYFSAITMTTVGYGDLTPGVGFAKSMAVLEAVMGQMILVTLVARTVAAVSQEQIRQRRHRKDT
jgi:hypothetical protein